MWPGAEGLRGSAAAVAQQTRCSPAYGSPGHYRRAGDTSSRMGSGAKQLVNTPLAPPDDRESRKLD